VLYIQLATINPHVFGTAAAKQLPFVFDQLLLNGLQPDRPDELARIEAAGGRVVYINGHRVRGILAMSRALGMVCLPASAFTHTVRSRVILVP
jgi:hypothetical protein